MGQKPQKQERENSEIIENEVFTPVKSTSVTKPPQNKPIDDIKKKALSGIPVDVLKKRVQKGRLLDLKMLLSPRMVVKVLSFHQVGAPIDPENVDSDMFLCGRFVNDRTRHVWWIFPNISLDMDLFDKYVVNFKYVRHLELTGGKEGGKSVSEFLKIFVQNVVLKNLESLIINPRQESLDYSNFHQTLTKLRLPKLRKFVITSWVFYNHWLINEKTKVDILPQLDVVEFSGARVVDSFFEANSLPNVKALELKYAFSYNSRIPCELIGKGWKKFHILKRLGLRHTNIGDDPFQMGLFPSLEQLSIVSCNNITGRKWQSLSRLASLFIDCSYWVDEYLYSPENVEMLRKLEIRRMKSFQSVEKWSKMENLETFTLGRDCILGGCTVGGHIMIVLLSKVQNAKIVQIKGNFEQQLVQQLDSSTPFNIEKLGVIGKFTPKFAEITCKQKSVTDLSLKNVGYYDMGVFEKTCYHFPNVKRLALVNCFSSGNIRMDLSKWKIFSPEKLESLTLHGIRRKGFDDELFQSLSFVQLRKLKIDACNLFTGKNWNSFPNLEKLLLGNCPLITDDIFANEKTFPNVKEIRLCSLELIFGIGWNINVEKIDDIVIRGCPNFGVQLDTEEDLSYQEVVKVNSRIPSMPRPYSRILEFTDGTDSVSFNIQTKEYNFKSVKDESKNDYESDTTTTTVNSSFKIIENEQKDGFIIFCHPEVVKKEQDQDCYYEGKSYNWNYEDPCVIHKYEVKFYEKGVSLKLINCIPKNSYIRDLWPMKVGYGV